MNRSGLNDAASGKLSCDFWASRILRSSWYSPNDPVSQSDSRLFAPHRGVENRPGALHFLKIVPAAIQHPPASTSSVSRDSNRGWRRNRSTAQASDEAVVS